MAIVNGMLFSEDGLLATLDGTAGVGTAVRLAGWSIAQAGQAYVVDLGADAVPAGSPLLAGFAHHVNGSRYVTTEAVAGSDQRLGGFRLRTDGAQRVTTAGADASDSVLGGWAVATTGEGRISV